MGVLSIVSRDKFKNLCRSWYHVMDIKLFSSLLMLVTSPRKLQLQKRLEFIEPTIYLKSFCKIVQFNKLTSVFHASVLLLTMNLVITLSK